MANHHDNQKFDQALIQTLEGEKVKYGVSYSTLCREVSLVSGEIMAALLC